MLADMTGGVAGGVRPSLLAADGDRLPGVEYALLPVDGLVPEHQVAIRAVECGQFVRGRRVNGVGRPSGDDTLQGVEIMTAVVGIRVAGNGGKCQQHKGKDQTSHNTNIGKIKVNPLHFPPLGWCFSAS